MMKKIKPAYLIILAVLLILSALTAYFAPEIFQNEPKYAVISLADVPAFSGEPYVVVEGNQPSFTEDDMTTESYEYFSPLDQWNRCGYVMACIGQDLMPTEDRGNIGQVKPSGWQSAKYDFVDGKYLYNRCHLIGFQLTGENANECNLITGTRYMNVDGMLPFENMVADYVKETGNHVLYRVTPIYEGSELVARGVQMEAFSVEDKGEGICFHVYVYNNQPGVTINYADGSSRESNIGTTEENLQAEVIYILNTSSGKFHSSDCSQGQSMKEENRQDITASRSQMLAQGYTPAKCCNP